MITGPVQEDDEEGEGILQAYITTAQESDLISPPGNGHCGVQRVVIGCQDTLFVRAMKDPVRSNLEAVRDRSEANEIASRMVDPDEDDASSFASPQPCPTPGVRSNGGHLHRSDEKHVLVSSLHPFVQQHSSLETSFYISHHPLAKDWHLLWCCCCLSDFAVK